MLPEVAFNQAQREPAVTLGLFRHWKMDSTLIDLTEQERTIVALLARGDTASRIAAKIDLTPRSVERQILNCRHKLYARNNAELVAKAISLGLFSFASA